MNLNNKIALFFGKAIALYVLWYLIYEQYLMKVGWLDKIIIDNLVNTSYKVLQLFGYTVFIYDQTIGIDGSHGVFIGTPCNGVELLALFAGFVLVFYGNWKHKMWYIPLGLILIHVLNIVRIIALTIIAYYMPETLDFNHKYTFTLLMYVVVFIGWIIWVKKFAVLSKENNQ
ncbi:MAG: archaeosortase/exosortase family protein [Flavobacteriales bacterium]|nr:archaeosortase/exosortase family protein [Flavobacteriales bacterium]